MSSSVAAFSPLRRASLAGSAQTRERWVRRRVGLAWSLLVLNVLTFYATTWDGLPLLVPVPSTVGKLVQQGAMPAALLVALSVNRRLVIRPNMFLCLLSLLVIEAAMTTVRGEFIYETLFGSVFRTTRLAGFVVTLWLLSPWWGRRDLLLVRCHLTAMSVLLGSVLAGLFIAPGHALSQGRLAGTLWPTPPPQVAHQAAVTTGLVAILWLCGRVSGRVTLLVVSVGGAILLMTHTRTALFAMLAGIVVAGLSLFVARARARKLFAAASVAVSLGAVTLSGLVTTWLERGQSAHELANLTGRTTVWQAMVSIPRNKFEVFFGFGLSNKSFNGLPIDSNWLASYFDQGLIGMAICAALLLFLLVTAYFQPRGVQRALALFLVTYCMVASLTETGLSDASPYLLELALAASLLAGSAVDRRQE